MDNSSLEKFCDTLGNVVLRDAEGSASIFVRHPKQNSIEFDASLPDHVHPAFIVNGVTDPALLIGKYMGSELKSGGAHYSLPNMPPKGGMNYDAFLEKMRAFGGDVSGLTIADHGLLVLIAHKMGILTYGNDNYGADYRAGTGFTLNKAVSQGEKRIFRGWEYTCLKAHTTSEELLPCDAPDYWEKGKHVGGTPVKSQYVSASNFNGYNTLTGSGPLEWFFNSDPCLEADLHGNAAEQVYGLRLVDGEIQILPDNNAADPAADLSASSTLWKAILPHANDSGHDLVDPGTSGTVHFTWQNGKLTLDTVAPAFESQNRNAPFKDIVSKMAHTPAILYELGLCPLPGTNVDGTVYVKLSQGEFVARRGGSHTVSQHAGIASLYFYHQRGSAGAYYGGRPRSRQKA